MTERWLVEAQKRERAEYGLVQLWHVYVFAFLLGGAAAFDAPARQTFVAELIEEPLLPNAVALNSTSFNGWHVRIEFSDLSSRPCPFPCSRRCRPI